MALLYGVHGFQVQNFLGLSIRSELRMMTRLIAKGRPAGQPAHFPDTHQCIFPASFCLSLLLILLLSPITNASVGSLWATSSFPHSSFNNQDRRASHFGGRGNEDERQEAYTALRGLIRPLGAL